LAAYRAEIGAIVAAIYLCERFWSPLMYLLAIAIIGARQHALLILMHDGVTTGYSGIGDSRLRVRVAGMATSGCGAIIPQESHRASSLFEQRKGSRLEAPDRAIRRGCFRNRRTTRAPAVRDVSGLNALVLIRLAASLVGADTVSAMFLVAAMDFTQSR